MRNCVYIVRMYARWMHVEVCEKIDTQSIYTDVMYVHTVELLLYMHMHGIIHI